MGFISAGLSFPLKDNLRLNAGFGQEKGNLDLDPTRYSAPLEKYYQLGFDYRLKTGTSFYFDWRDRSREDRLPDPEFNYQEQTFRFGVGQSFKKITLYASAESGKTKDELNSQTSHLQRYTVSAYFRPTDKQSYSGYLYYDNNNFTEQKRRSIITGLNSSFQIRNRTFFNLNLQTNDYEESYSGSRDIFEIRLSHILPNRNKISVYTRHASYRNSDERDESALMAEYTIHFGLPISLKKSIGMVKGYVYDEETNEAISNVILRLNSATAVSDKNGNFSFPSLKPGTYYLNIDTAGIGLNRITVRKTPMEVTVEGGRETSVEIGITRAATLLGQIILYNFENNHNNNGDPNIKHYIVGRGDNNNISLNGETKLVKAYGLANILVELRSGSEIKRWVTERDGRFEFGELRPGKWSLKIYKDNLPEYHYFKKDIFEFELEHGEKNEILVKVLPRKRRIHIIEEGGTLLEEEKETKR